VQSGDRLGLGICHKSGIVHHISPGGVIAALNAARPGSVAVADRITEVNGRTGNAAQLMRSWIGNLSGGSEDLHFKVVRPVEIDIHVDISANPRLGLSLDCDFVTAIGSEGALAMHNAIHAPRSPQCVRTGDRIVQVSGREPAQEDGADPNVIPYLSLAVAGGASPLTLRLRRGDVMRPREPKKEVSAGASCGLPAHLELARQLELELARQQELKSTDASSFAAPAPVPETLPRSRKPFACSFLSILFKPSAMRLKDNLNLGRKAKQGCKVHSSVDCKDIDPSTPSTAESPTGRARSEFSDMSRDECLVLPGVVRRIA
jgi:hypothetical protein